MRANARAAADSAVLLVEATGASSGYLAASLRDNGFTVRTAQDRTQALARGAA